MRVTDIEPCIKVTKEGEIPGTGLYIEFGDQVRITDSEGVKTEGRFYLFESGAGLDEDDMLYIILEDENQFRIGVSSIDDLEKIEK
ncbi:MAG: hypothetical protein PHQ32_03015 [Firmicutes bacterium]|nr:hypothetical protein [Bacillota bacterium]